MGAQTWRNEAEVSAASLTRRSSEGIVATYAKQVSACSTLNKRLTLFIRPLKRHETKEGPRRTGKISTRELNLLKFKRATDSYSNDPSERYAIRGGHRPPGARVVQPELVTGRRRGPSCTIWLTSWKHQCD